MSIGTRMKERRLQLNKTLEEVGSVVGVSKATIQRYEKGAITNIPSDKIEKIAKALSTTPAFLMGWEDKSNRLKGVRIPILGRVVAGIPLEAITDIEGYEEITPKMASLGEYFALRIKGHSMEPRIEDGEIVIVKQQEDVECGDVAIVLVNGDEATCKQVKKSPEGITLIGFNPVVYPPHFYSNKEIEELPVRVIGRVVESRKTW
ncbi:MAG: LexA family transcriptional regulator [Veillonellaceae bacterium]|nr:MAG: LexA family transcriptional regulator [Veillonellaceae bacterium]